MLNPGLRIPKRGRRGKHYSNLHRPDDLRNFTPHRYILTSVFCESVLTSWVLRVLPVWYLVSTTDVVFSRLADEESSNTSSVSYWVQDMTAGGGAVKRVKGRDHAHPKKHTNPKPRTPNYAVRYSNWDLDWSQSRKDWCCRTGCGEKKNGNKFAQNLLQGFGMLGGLFIDLLS